MKRLEFYFPPSNKFGTGPYGRPEQKFGHFPAFLKAVATLSLCEKVD